MIRIRSLPRPCPYRRAATLMALCLAGIALPAHAQDPVPPPRDLASLDIDELAQIRVTSAGRKPESISDATSAISVLTQEDIRRSGATSLPEALRLIPGLQVARVGGRDWAVSARGFNEESSNKLLVLIDGRTVYSTIFAGVNWETITVPLGSIDRIEVIRGPGGTLWGANAMNGVINIITLPAQNSPGTRLAAGAGTWDRVFGSAQYGGDLGENTAIRVYGAARSRDPAEQLDGSEAEDDWQFGQIGFRLDAGYNGPNRWTLQGDAYVGTGDGNLRIPADTAPFAEFTNADLDVSGGNLTGSWTHVLSSTSEYTVLAYYDRSERVLPELFGTMTENLANIELQHRFQLARRHDIVWGAGYRLLFDEVTGGQSYGFIPRERTTHLVTGFVQDEFWLAPDRFSVTLGTKAEHNSYTGLEFMPNLRLLWTPRAGHSAWGAVSRALRTPSRVDVDADATSSIPNLPFKAVLAGNEDFEAEELIAYELGYRLDPSLQMSFDLSLFYNDYDRLRTLTVDTILPTSPRPTVIVPITNQARGHTGGLEFAATWRVSSWLRFRGSYAWLDSDLELTPDASSATSITGSRTSSEHQATLWTSLDLPARTQLDLIVRYLSELGSGIPEYASADVRFSWLPSDDVELTLGGQDLFQRHHREFAPSAFDGDARAIPRRGYAKVAWRF